MPLRELGITAHLHAVGHPGVAVSGVLVNLSAGGCCLAVGASAAGTLAVGSHVIVHLPVSSSGLDYPATLAGIDQCPGVPAEMLARLRFRKADPLSQQRLTHWIGQLAIRHWHS